ncbi:MAG TPA: sugar phosphate nucleotidyltransferase, partial [Spirochaetales bacterium]|nr:sugar phosphate nucleotidyltransferase [Spirochaetales bacterium]
RVLILSADHLIEPLEAFIQDVRNAAELSARGWVTVFGVPPSSPHTGYGYLERGEAEGMGFRVKAFKEKPDEQTARSYLATGRYYWNSGMFLFTLEMLFSQYEQYAAEVVNSFRDARLMEPWSLEEIPVEEIQCAYERVPSISVDYAVLERSNRVAMIPASFSWNDVGSWDEVARLLPNEAPNIVELEGSNNAVYSDIPVALCGVENLIVVIRNGRALVLKKGKSQLVREASERLS